MNHEAPQHNQEIDDSIEILEPVSVSSPYFAESLAAFNHERWGEEKINFEQFLDAVASGWTDAIEEVGLTADLAREWEADPKTSLINDGSYPKRHHDGYPIFLQMKRFGLGMEFIQGFLMAVQEKRLAEYFKVAMPKERGRIAEIMSQPEVREQLAGDDAEREAFFGEMNVPVPLNSTLRIQFVGPYENFISQSPSEQGHRGFYSPELNFMVIYLTGEELKSGSLGERTRKTYIHEKFHASSAEQLPIIPEKDANIFPVARKTGFSLSKTGQVEEGDRSQNMELFLNEGMTELLARIVAYRRKIYNPEEVNPHGYDDFVDLVTAIAMAMSDKEITADPSMWPTHIAKDKFLSLNKEVVKNLLSDYVSIDGMLLFGKKMEQSIGKYSYIILDQSVRDGLEEIKGGFFRQFLERRILQKKDERRTFEDNYIHLRKFRELVQDFHVDYDELKQLYPFIVP